MYRDELLKSLLGQRELALLQINQTQPGQGTEVARLEFRVLLMSSIEASVLPTR